MPTQILSLRKIFYVYVLFDSNGIPRYIGKGHGKRWLEHEWEYKKGKLKKNRRKRAFLAMTLAARGEIPKIKLRERLTEREAFEIELAFIKAIGIHPEGPLVNRTYNRHGPSSETLKQWHASRTVEQRSATLRKSRASMSSEANSELGRRNALSVGRQELRKRMAAWQASLTVDERSRNGRKGGTASNLARSAEYKKMQGMRLHQAHMSMTPEQRKEIAKRTGVAKLTQEQLSKNGKKGVAIANSRRTPEERSALARKAALAGVKKRKQIREMAISEAIEFQRSGSATRDNNEQHGNQRQLHRRPPSLHELS